MAIRYNLSYLSVCFSWTLLERFSRSIALWRFAARAYGIIKTFELLWWSKAASTQTASLSHTGLLHVVFCIKSTDAREEEQQSGSLRPMHSIRFASLQPVLSQHLAHKSSILQNVLPLTAFSQMFFGSGHIQHKMLKAHWAYTIWVKFCCDTLLTGLDFIRTRFMEASAWSIIESSGSRIIFPHI